MDSQTSVHVIKTACHIVAVFVCPAVLCTDHYLRCLILCARLQSLASKAEFMYFVELHLTDTDLQLAGKSSANARRKAISDWAAKTGNMETTVASLKENQAQAVPQQQPRKHRPSASQVAPIPKETATAPEPKRPRKR
ncbi:hypothetical protein Pelo_13532 [Pelomyxa schiedti]|nr:hypothetical protein Pelo_13532 [Pelomyxa schiedti]